MARALGATTRKAHEMKDRRCLYRVAFFSNRSLHKLAATALGAGGLAVGNKFDAILGASYASLMHLTGGLKKLPD